MFVTIAGPDNWRKSKIDYLDGLGAYESRLFSYMAQVGAYFLISSRPDPIEVLKNGHHPSFVGMFETPIQQAISSSSHGVDNTSQTARELEEIKYFLKCVDEGKFEPNLSEIKKYINRLPKPLPLKKEGYESGRPSRQSQG